MRRGEFTPRTSRSGRCCALLLVLAGYAAAAFPDEGMWTYDHFPAAQMRAKYGWAPGAAWLRHWQFASIRLVQGCSASLVSSEGLVMTNHHCVRACLNDLADATHDYLADGFYARSVGDERKCPALEANQLVQITNVTRQVQLATAGKSDRAFHEAERAAKARIERACGTSAQVRCQVVALFNGGVYDLYKYKRYQDLRVVFAPEESAAFFGGDPDNFTFPRYDLDVAFVRIYDHVKPLRTDDYLKFATTAVRQGDIAFVSGNPGGTEREDTLAELQFQRDVAQPFNLSFLSELRGVVSEFGALGAQQARSSKTLRFSIENSLKTYQGRQMALVQGPLIADKAREEEELRERLATTAGAPMSDGREWDAIVAAIMHARQIYARLELLEQFPQRISPLLGQAIALNRYAAEAGKPDGRRLEEYTDANFPTLKQKIASPAPIHAELEQTILAWWLQKLRENLGAQDADVEALMRERNPQEITDAIIGGTRLMDASMRAQLLAGGPAAIDAYRDPLLEFARALDGPARAVRDDYENCVQAVITKNAGLIAKARFALAGSSAYPDATFTLRLSYGTVMGYQENGDAVAATTKFSGAYAHAGENEPFRLPLSWINAEQALDPDVNLNFVSTNDIVGGNSGSPVIGRNGEVIGLIFDGNIESLGGYYGYDGGVNRAIAVDARGIIEALRKIYHADRLVKELSP
jgi:Peptidase S46